MHMLYSRTAIDVGLGLSRWTMPSIVQNDLKIVFYRVLFVYLGCPWARHIMCVALNACSEAIDAHKFIN